MRACAESGSFQPSEGAGLLYLNTVILMVERKPVFQFLCPWVMGR